MRTVYFVRHAKSSWDNPMVKDIDRPLNERGERDAPFMAKLLKSKGVKPDALVSSPAKRAFSTAVYFAQTFDIMKDNIEVNPHIYEADVEDIMDVIQELPEECHTVFIFGHNPTFTQVVNQFTERSIMNVPTCGVCKVESSADTWAEFKRSNAQLTEFYYPKQYLS
ncbi:MAG: SixA phosphatase family protein [Saprospiraceae bacterium]